MVLELLRDYWYVLIALLIVFAGLKTVNQGTIAVVTVFGRYQRVLRPGLRLMIPFI